MAREQLKLKKEARPNPEEIAQRAYELFLKRGGEHGNDWNDWFEAETQLKKAKAN